MINGPMMSDQEIKIIDKLLAELKPKVCLEWGSGGSTVYFPPRHPEIETWVSIEHNGKFYDEVKNSVSSKVELKHVKINEYLNAAMDKKYDFILVDGLMRQECLLIGKDLLNEGGVMLLHDSGRPEFDKIIKQWGNVKKLSDGQLEVKGFAHRGLHLFSL